MKQLGTILLFLITFVAQFIAGYLVMFLLAFITLSTLLNKLGLVGLDNPNPWWNDWVTFPTFVFSAALGVWGVGWLAAKLRKQSLPDKLRFWGAVLFGFIGVLIIVITPAHGFVQMTYPLFGTIIGYYTMPAVIKLMPDKAT